jgi:hypothetical protein
MAIPKPRTLIRQWYFWLIVVTGIAIILRSIPAWINPAWGCDFGIYYGLTNSLIKSGELFNPYYGWGSSYQYFPVLYAITGAAHWLTGIDVLTLMPKIAPLFGGLSVFLFYFVVYELLGDKKKALLSTLFLAVMPFHVYQTSHASPLTVGHFFMMFSLYLFIKFRRDTRYILPLSISTSLLIMSHHLTTYMYLISLIFIVFIENIANKQWTDHVKKDALYILGTSSCIFAYWITVATPIYESFIRTGLKVGTLHVGSSTLIILFYLMFFAMFGIIHLIRKVRPYKRKSPPSAKSPLTKFFAAISIALIIMVVFSVVKLPWTNFSFTPLSILYSLPLLIMVSLGVVGFRSTELLPNGWFIRGWLGALLLSFIFSLVTNSTVLFPHRHIEYMMAPLSIISMCGFNELFSSLKIDKKNLLDNLHTIKKPSIFFIRKNPFKQNRQFLYLTVILLLVTANAASVYPSHVALNASYEVITDENLAAIDWIENHVDKNRTIIASDHRLARVAEAIGYNTTLDEACDMWITKSYIECLDELEGIGKNYSRITHIIIDDVMKERVVHVGFGQIYYMSNDSYDKFSFQPFTLVFRNATKNEKGVEEHWTEVYKVNWNDIDTRLYNSFF